MAYIPDPADTTEPLESRPAGSAAEEFRALKAVVAALVVAASAAPSVRQAVQSAVPDANGYNNAITVGAGLRPGLTASAADSYHLSYAAGFSGGKAVNFDESIEANNADILGADLPTNNTSFIYRNYGVGFGSTLVPPQYGNTFDRTQGSLLNFEGVNGAVTTTDDFGNQWTFAGNARIDTAQKKFDTSSLLLDGAGDYTKTTNITTFGNDSWEYSLWFRISALPGAGTFAQLVSAHNGTLNIGSIVLSNTAGTTKLRLLLSSNGSSNDIADVSGINTVWTLNQWNRVRVIFDALAGMYKVFLSLNGAIENTEIAVASTARVCTLTGLALGAKASDGSDAFNGWIDAFRFLHCATKTSAETPSVVAPTITDYPVHFFNILQMKMYEVTAPSIAANTNPVLTARTKLFLGECDTSGVAVTAVRNYAVRGEYESAPIAVPAASTTTPFQANIGTTSVKVQAEAICMAAEAAHKPGEVAYPMCLYVTASADRVTRPELIKDRNTLAVMTGLNGLQVMSADGSGTTFTLGVNWKIRIRAKRNF